MQDNTNLLLRISRKKQFKNVMIEFCYLELKFLKKEIKSKDCPFGLSEWDKEKCVNCRYYGESIIGRED